MFEWNQITDLKIETSSKLSLNPSFDFIKAHHKHIFKQLPEYFVNYG